MNYTISCVVFFCTCHTRKNRICIVVCADTLFCMFLFFLREKFIQFYFLTRFPGSVSTNAADPLFISWKRAPCSPSLSSNLKSGSCGLLWLFSSPRQLYLSPPHSLAPSPLRLIRDKLSLSFLSSSFYASPCFCFFKVQPPLFACSSFFQTTCPPLRV